MHLVSPSRLVEVQPTPISQLEPRTRAVVRGRIVSMTYPSEKTIPQIRVNLRDESGTLIVNWLGRRDIPGVQVGDEIIVEGIVSWQESELIMSNPSYQIITIDEE